MAIIILSRPAVKVPEVRTIFTELLDLANNTQKGSLMLVNRNNGLSYQVLGYHPDTGVAKLKATSSGAILRPKLTERESAIYRAVWR